ncbi:MAG: pyridoxamine 5'-phosphate oxidase family protein [Mycolicibacterium insubricum]|nr:pyridoxamine 5'-phosphate oxidase family protein [Mycobacterium sp.]
MSTVDLDRLAAALADYDQAFLVTVGDDHRSHAVLVDPVLADGVFDVGPFGGHTATNIATHSVVSLLWPPREPGGYALMVDGRAEPGLAGTLWVVPTKALLHRRAKPGSAAAESGCLHDCVVFKA